MHFCIHISEVTSLGLVVIRAALLRRAGIWILDLLRTLLAGCFSVSVVVFVVVVVVWGGGVYSFIYLFILLSFLEHISSKECQKGYSMLPPPFFSFLLFHFCIEMIQGLYLCVCGWPHLFPCEIEWASFYSYKNPSKKSFMPLLPHKSTFSAEVYVCSSMGRSLMSLRNWKCLMLLVWGERFCTAVAVTGYLLKLLHIRCYTNTDKHPNNLCLTETGNEKSERNTRQYLYHTLRKKTCYTLILKKK